ncbi:alpha/beta fold hydrolase [Zobellia barbeyronii]|uniref:Alpha/beta hydrolase n=1 Tax=Zobellia barbeyronii TaxID=2748009 RepID=A0ABS5WK26_9FLAO|nr:alpha/beta hydrolase [Zobellia barbeyronii]MBT2163595.1 alpha/beta hydrolase [Zobellia barbeyronii]
MNLKKVVGVLQRISPKLTAKVAFKFISKPKNRKIRSFEKSILGEARKSSIKFRKFDIKVFKWGNGNKKALVIHGWGGRAANFGAIIPKLIENGYEVISFDAPCHGNSTRRRTSFFEISDLVKLFLQKEKYDLVITHSMGSVFALLAMSSLKYKIQQLIILTTPNRFLEFIGAAVLHFGLNPKTTKLLINKVRKTSEYEPITLKASRFVKDIETKLVTFIHDKADKIIPINTSKKVSASIQNSDFIEIEGTGHFKMLWSKKVVQIIADLTSENSNLIATSE